MAKYRNVHIDFWQDGFVLDLTPEEKYFYLYLMTNSKTTQCGIYELPYRIMETETGYSRETVQKLIDRFVEYDKIAYNCPTKEIVLLNWAKYNFINSPKVLSRINKELESVKYQPFVDLYIAQLERYGYPIDTLCIDIEKEKEKEKDKEKENEAVVEIINHLNSVADKNFSADSKKTRSLIQTLIKNKHSLDDFKTVIERKAKQWKNDPKMDNYLRPITLFAASNFESYLNEKDVASNHAGATKSAFDDLYRYAAEKDEQS